MFNVLLQTFMWYLYSNCHMLDSVWHIEESEAVCAPQLLLHYETQMPYSCDSNH